MFFNTRKLHMLTLRHMYTHLKVHEILHLQYIVHACTVF